MPPEIVQHVPGIQTAVVTVRKYKTQCVGTDRFDPFNGHITLAGLQHFLSGSVATSLG